MNSYFQVGEIAIVQNCALACNNGKEVEILAVPRDTHWINEFDRGVEAGNYLVQGPLARVQIPPSHLRKKHERTQWNDCIWQPLQAKA